MICQNKTCGKEINTTSIESYLTEQSDRGEDGHTDEDFACPHCGAPYRAQTRIVIDFAPKYSYASAIGGVPVTNPEGWPGKWEPGT